MKRMKSNKLILIAVALGYFSTSSIAEENPRCVASKSALKSLEDKIFDQPRVKDGETLRQLEIEKAELEAEMAILNSFKSIHKQREEFLKKLNPTHPESIYSDRSSVKSAVQGVQTQIISNYILTSITSSISAILENENFLRTSDTAITSSPEWIAAGDSQYEKFKILADGNPYDFIKNRCKELGRGSSPSDPCRNFSEIEDNALITLFKQTNQDMVSDVTDNFFKAFETARGNKANLDKELKEIQHDHITKHIDINSLTKERTILIGSLLDKQENTGFFDSDNLSEFFKVDSIDPRSDQFIDNPLKAATTGARSNHSIEEIKKLEESFESAQNCFARRAFGIDTDCAKLKDEEEVGQAKKDEEEEDKKIKGTINNFFSGMNALGFNQIEDVAGEDDSKLFANDDVKKFSADNLVKDIAKKEMGELKLLGVTPEQMDSKKFASMSKVCPNLKATPKPPFPEALWTCLDKFKDGEEQNQFYITEQARIKKSLKDNKTKLDQAHQFVKDTYGDIVKYSADIARDSCGQAIKTCGGSNLKLTALTIGTDEFLTNLNKVEWELSGKKETEEILESTNKQCSPFIQRARQARAAASQGQAAQTPSTNEILDICKYASNDLKTLQANTVTEEQKKFRRSYHSKYNRATGKMEHIKKTGIGTMIAKSAGNSLVNTGLPLYIQNMGFKNSLAYKTDMAIYQKNYMYMLNNPQFWSTSMFTGYGVSSPLNGYASSSYYSFGN
ncbi:hypothetical protein BIY24_10095 [Halobacteriovorax marinus]|uniref:hypothetical protein n=1 Tax=Halobacteriovorax marinus TaxID=97084 RepID=UPI000BC2DE4C|nr:hypothetical protein [Halobacteriovorax marinus]ATH08284.1 hypothetical protein BIY24_10095 [Halobacteriovorax marinus]